MATKRDYYNIDPDYEDVSEQQNKRQRLIEKDAKEETIRKIENIIRKEISHEIRTREDELNHIDQSIYQARHLLDRLRACLVANYYSNAPQGTLSQDNSASTSAPFIHPTVKKYLGKHPLTSKESEDRQASEKDPWQDNRSSRVADKSSLSNGSSGGSNQAGKTSTNTSSSESPLTSQSGIKSVTQTNSNGSRTSRFRIKKKIIVGNASKFIPLDRREDNDPSTHKWLIYVRGPKEEPQIDHFVKKVWFFLHPSYRPNDLVEIVHPPFHLSRRGWGEFPVRVQLHFYDQRNKRVDIIHQLKLDRTYTGLQTLGAETTVEIEIEKENVFDRSASVAFSGNLPCLSVSPLPCPSNNLSSTKDKTVEAEHKTIVETTVRHSPMKKESPLTEAEHSLPAPCSTGQSPRILIQPNKKETASIMSSQIKILQPKESTGVSLLENTNPAIVSRSLVGGNEMKSASASTNNHTEPTTAIITTMAVPPLKSTAPLPSPIIITTPPKSLASSSTVKIGTSLTGSSVPQAPYFVALSSIANPKLSIPVIMTNATTRSKNPVIVTPATASSKPGNLQFSTAIPTTKVQPIQGVPLNNLLKTLNSNSKVLWMSPPLLPQVRTSKPTGVIPTSLSTSSSHLTSSAQSISSILVPPSLTTSSSLTATQDKTNSVLFTNPIALTTTVSTASSSKCSTTECSTGAKLLLTGDTSVKGLPASPFETRPIISSLDNNYITIQFNTNPTEVTQAAPPTQKKVTGDKSSTSIKEGNPVISPFRVTPQGLVSIPSRLSPSSTTVQATAAQLSKTNPTSSVPIVQMSTGQQPTGGTLSSPFKTLGKLPTGTGTAPIILLSGASATRTSTVVTTTTTPNKKVTTQQPQGLLIPSNFSQSVVRPVSTEVKNIPNKTSLLFLSPTTNSGNLVKGPATSGNKGVFASQPSIHNTINTPVSAVHPQVLASATNSSLVGNPPTTKVCIIQNSPQITDMQKATAGTSQQLKCNVLGSHPSALTSSKQTYVLTTTKNKGLSLLPSHLVLKAGLEGRPDATQSVLYKTAPADNMATTQILSSVAPAGLMTLAPSRPMLLLKNQKAPMILTNQIGSSSSSSATSVTPSQMQVLSSNKPTQPTSVMSTGKDNENPTMSLQLQYANGHLVLAPPTIRSTIGNNVPASGQKIFLKVLPSTTASSTMPTTNGPKVVNGNSPLNIVSLTTPAVPASSISNSCSPMSTNIKASQDPNPLAQNSKPVKNAENEKRIHGYNKIKKCETAQPTTVPLINLGCLPDMISLIRSAVRLHPIVSANIDRSLHPYAAFTTDQWLSWNIGKRRASEWQRALSVRLYILQLLNGATSFQGEKVWTTKQIFCWCRLHAYSPHHLEPSAGLIHKNDELLSSTKNSPLPLQPLSSFSSMAALVKRLDLLETQIQTPHLEDEIEVDIISTDFPKVRIKQETESSSSCQWQTTPNHIFLPVSDSALYVQDVARQVGVHFKPTQVSDQIHGSMCEMMLFSSLKNLMSDVLRTAFALKSSQGRYPEELSVADIHAALSNVPGADFLTNSYLGLVSHPDTHSNDHHKQKHGIT